MATRSESLALPQEKSKRRAAHPPWKAIALFLGPAFGAMGRYWAGARDVCGHGAGGNCIFQGAFPPVLSGSLVHAHVGIGRNRGHRLQVDL
jgi:hypothetical protein